MFCYFIQTVCIKKIFLKPAINRKCIKSCYGGFRQTEFVKNFSYKKLVGKIPDIGDS